MTETGPRPGAGTGLRTGLGQSRAPHAPGAQVDAWDKEEDAVHVTSSTELTPAYPGQVPMTDKGMPFTSVPLQTAFPAFCPYP